MYSILNTAMNVKVMYLIHQTRDCELQNFSPGSTVTQKTDNSLKRTVRFVNANIKI